MPKKEIAVQRKRAATPKKVTKTTAPPKSKSATASAAKTSPPAAVMKKGRQEPPEKVKTKELPGAQVCADHQRRTCILFERSSDQVRFVALDIENGLDLGLAEPKHFDDRFKPMVDYPVEKAAKLYVEYARGLGATERVMRLLAKLTTVTHEDIEMATAKKGARAAAPVKTDKKAPAKKAAGKAAPEKEVKAKGGKAKPAPVEKKGKAAPTEKAKKAPAEKKDRGPTAAKRFQELIMEGKKTDDQIFAVVQKEFGLDDNKRSYVKWYRNYLTKQGQNPPAAKE